jgi:hypothetical protein
MAFYHSPVDNLIDAHCKALNNQIRTEGPIQAKTIYERLEGVLNLPKMADQLNQQGIQREARLDLTPPETSVGDD